MLNRTLMTAGLAMAALFVVHASRAQDGAAATVAPAPKIVCEDPTFDFGTLDNSQSVLHDFAIRNDGDLTLEIIRAKPSCGCTVANISQKLIEPGQSAVISAKLNLTNREGKQTKIITVESNDPATPQTRLTMQGTAVSQISTTPRTVAVTSMTAGEIVSNVVTVTSQLEDPLVLLSAETGNPHISARIEPVEGANAAKVILTTAETLPKGSLFGRLTIKTNQPKKPVISVPFRYSVIGEISVYPGELTLLDQQAALTRIITLGPGLVKEFNVTWVEVPDDTMVAKVQSLNNNRYRIILSNILPTADLDGKNIKIMTTAANMEEVLVPIRVIRRN